MKVDTALLSDAVSIREGLLHILGGGVTRIWAERFPAPINATLALRVLIPPEEARSPGALQLAIVGPDGEEIGSFNLDFGVGTPEAEVPTSDIPVPLAIPLSQVQLPGPGHYEIEVRSAGALARAIPLEAANRPPQG